MPVILAGARHVQEVVVERHKVVDWILSDRQGPTVVYADDGSIFVFDLEGRRLHKLIGNTYSYNEILEIDTQNNTTRVRIQMDVERDVRAVLSGVPPFPALARLHKLCALHPSTQERIRRLFTVH